MERKICKHCGLEKDATEYQKAGKGKWLQPYCKPCDTIRKRKHVELNAEKIKQQRAEYYVVNKERIRNREQRKRLKFRELNPIVKKEKKPLDIDKKKEYMKKWREDNIAKVKQYNKVHGKYSKRKEYKKKYQQEKMKEPNFVLLKRLRGRVYLALKRGVKSDYTVKLLGCSLDFFKQHIESKFTDGMSWDNMGAWHLDHIKPCILFDLSKDEEQRICFHYSNIQPLWGLDNLKKGIKYE